MKTQICVPTQICVTLIAKNTFVANLLDALFECLNNEMDVGYVKADFHNSVLARFGYKVQIVRTGDFHLDSFVGRDDVQPCSRSFELILETDSSKSMDCFLSSQNWVDIIGDMGLRVDSNYLAVKVILW